MISKTSIVALTLCLLSFCEKASASLMGETYTERGVKEDLQTCSESKSNECINENGNAVGGNESTKEVSSLSPGVCLDDRSECPQYAARGDCKTHTAFMLAHCKFSCKACPSNLSYFASDYGEAQESYGDKAAEIEKVILEAEDYMKNTVLNRAMYQSVRHKCLNRDKLCSKWAAEGECTSNPNWMQIQCAVACQSCEKLDHRIRCPIDPLAPKAFSPGDIDMMFMRILTDPFYQRFAPKALSRPPEELTGVVTSFYEHQKPKEDAPWVITLEQFLTPEECDHLINMGGVIGYEESFETGERQLDGTYKAVQSGRRTSHNAWCREKGCYEDKITQQILAKVENITSVPEKNYEFLQLLRYQKGDFYKEHTDYVPGDSTKAQGVRALTFFIYLNDMEDDAGGETAFQRLGLSIRPTLGKAVLWPNVQTKNPDAWDPRLSHEAVEVTKGVKYAANLWIHQKDFKNPFYEVCN